MNTRTLNFGFLLTYSLLSTSAFAADLNLISPLSIEETVETFDCSTGESLGIQTVGSYLETNACLAPACAKHQITDDNGITWDYCEGACSDNKACTATYRDPQNPGKGIKRCSCKPVQQS